MAEQALASVPCPVCAGQTDPHVVIDTMTIRRCQRCLHQFYDAALSAMHVQEQYGDNYFEGGGTAGYADYLSTGHLVAASAKRYAEQVAPYLQHQSGSLLEIGCAAGFAMQGFAQAGWDVTGIDPNESMVAVANERKADSAFVGTLETLSSIRGLQVPESGFDLVVIQQVIAHLHDLPTAQAELQRLVRPGGSVLIETWDSASYSARVLGKRWHEYSPPSAIHYFCRQSLDQFMAAINLQRIAKGRPAKQISVGHARSILEYSYGKSALMKTALALSRPIPDRIALPYPSEDLFWHLYRMAD